VWGGDVVRLEELKRRPFEVRRLTLQVDEDAFLISTTRAQPTGSITAASPTPACAAR
jgi:hypothetical protein